MFSSILSIVSGVLLILLFLLMIISVFSNKLSDSTLILTFMIVAFLGAFNLGMGVVSLFEHKETIQPIEVYRGNTELEITSVNGTPIDTVVVFKKELKH